MKVLVAYASKTGFTKGIAEFICERLRQRAIQADVQEVKAVRELGSYDAYVIGSAAYMGHWIKEAKDFVSKNRNALAGRPVWLFSSGPVGSQTTDAKGRDLLETSEPKEIEEFRGQIKPRGHQVFFGGLDGARLTGPVGFMYRLAQKSETARESMPEGDFRDWKVIGGWADSIADSLGSPIVVH